MKLCVAILALAMASVALAEQICYGTGGTIRQFNKRKEDTKMPCKFNAVHQTCGDYEVTVTPGNIYLHPDYHLDSLWLKVKEIKSGRFWNGRTDNKLAVKFFNGWSKELFNRKGGKLGTKSLLKFGKNKRETFVKSRNGDFIVTFRPWDPDSKKYSRSRWSFECKKKDFEPVQFPDQICGGDERQEVAERFQELELESRDQAVYYDVFMNDGISQTNPKCAEATKLMTKKCTEEQRRTAMITCSQILSSYHHTKCVTKYSCDPMDVFVDCLSWVCSDFKDNGACERVGSGIDMCRNFPGGDLSQKVEEANCYQDFIPIKK